jgi:hypothetical protein
MPKRNARAGFIDPDALPAHREVARGTRMSQAGDLVVRRTGEQIRGLQRIGCGYRRELGLADKLNRKKFPHSGASDDEIAKMIGISFADEFPNDYPGVQSAMLDGVPTARQSSSGQNHHGSRRVPCASYSPARYPAAAQAEIPRVFPGPARARSRRGLGGLKLVITFASAGRAR